MCPYDEIDVGDSIVVCSTDPMRSDLGRRRDAGMVSVSVPSRGRPGWGLGPRSGWGGAGVINPKSADREFHSDDVWNAMNLSKFVSLRRGDLLRVVRTSPRDLTSPRV